VRRTRGPAVSLEPGGGSDPAGRAGRIPPRDGRRVVPVALVDRQADGGLKHRTGWTQTFVTGYQKKVRRNPAREDDGSS